MILSHPALLITDDDLAFRETLRGVFEDRGYQTLLAADGEQALEIAAHHQIHVALLDMHMPRLTGLETLRRLKTIQSVTPCILISAALDEALAEEARRAAAFQALAKPVRVADVTAAVSQAMRLTYDWPAA